MTPIVSNKITPQKRQYMIRGEEGNVLILSLILLVLLTMLGISATQTSSIDLQVAGNNKTYKMNLFSGEAAAFEAIQNLEETDLVTAAPNWILPEDTSDDDIRDSGKWDGGFTGGTSQVSSLDPDPNATVRYVTVVGGFVDTGESLDATRVKINEYSVYGRCDRDRGTGIVKVGYRKAF